MSNASNQGVNIKVFVRARPLNKLEQTRTNTLVKLHSSSNLIEIQPKQYQGNLSSKVYQFDRVFGPETTQQQFYRDAVSPLLDDFIQGYNATLMLYGPTGSGKSYSVFGENGCLDGVSSGGLSAQEIEDSEKLGAIPRVVSELFEKLQRSQIDFQLRVSNVEVYQEEIFDLLVENQSFRESLKIYEERQSTGNQNSSRNKVLIQNITEQLVKNTAEVLATLQRSNKNRKVAETKMNEHSSRSHSIFTLQLIQKQLEINQNTSQEIEFIKISKLHLVDLAGSESITKSGLDARSKAQAEAGNINKSLLTLGRVINALVDGTSFIPYRDSKLTRLLSDSLGGTTKTCIVSTISLADLHADETGNTLDYMTRAKKIKNVPIIMQKINSRTVLKEYSEEMQKLQQMLQQQRAQNGGIFISNEDYEAQKQREAENRQKIEELEAQLAEIDREMQRIAELLQTSQQKYAAVRGALGTSVDEYNVLQRKASVIDNKLRLEREAAARNRAALLAATDAAAREVDAGLAGAGAISLRQPFDQALRVLDAEIAQLYKSQLAASGEAGKLLKANLAHLNATVEDTTEKEFRAQFSKVYAALQTLENTGQTFSQQIGISERQIGDFVKTQMQSFANIGLGEVDAKTRLLHSRADGAMKARQRFAKEQGEQATRHVSEVFDQIKSLRQDWAAELKHWVTKELINVFSNAERVSILQQGELMAMIQSKVEQQHKDLLGLVRNDLKQLESTVSEKITAFTNTLSEMEKANDRFRETFHSRMERNAADAEQDIKELEKNTSDVLNAVFSLKTSIGTFGDTGFPEQNKALVVKPMERISASIEQQRKDVAERLQKAEEVVQEVVLNTVQTQSKKVEDEQGDAIKHICVLYSKQFNQVSIQGEEVRYQQLAALSQKVAELQRRSLEIAQNALKAIKDFKMVEAEQVRGAEDGPVEQTPYIPRSPQAVPLQLPDGLAQSRMIYYIQQQNHGARDAYGTPSISGTK